MTEAEFQQIEEKLGLKLPAAYRKIMSAFPEDLADWPPSPGETENRRIEDFLLDVAHGHAQSSLSGSPAGRSPAVRSARCLMRSSW